MVLCIVVGCSKRSGRDKDVSFYRIPKIIRNRGEETKKLSEKRRNGFVAAISSGGSRNLPGEVLFAYGVGAISKTHKIFIVTS